MADRAVWERSGTEAWEAFYVTHGEPRFFKERRYLTLAFPFLRQEDPPITVLDMGSGYGSSMLPLLKAQQHVTLCHMSIAV